MSDLNIIHQPQAHRFETHLDGHVAHLDYALRPGGVVVMEHTIVPDALGGRGVGSALARHALDWAAAQGLKVDVQCSFIRGYIAKRPEYQGNTVA